MKSFNGEGLWKSVFIVYKSTRLGGFLPFTWISENDSYYLVPKNRSLALTQMVLYFVWLFLSAMCIAYSWNISDEVTQWCSLAILSGFSMCIGPILNVTLGSTEIAELFLEFFLFEKNWRRCKL